MPVVDWPNLGTIDVPDGADMGKVAAAAKRIVPTTTLATLLGGNSANYAPAAYADPKDSVPDSFPLTQKVATRVINDPSQEPYDTGSRKIETLRGYGGNYEPHNGPYGTINVNAAAGGHDPIVIPHETGHAIWNELNGNPQAQANWMLVHSKNLQDNKALGNYIYSDNPSHSFADAFATYATSPDKLQKLFPEVYDYFKNLTGFEYSRKQPPATRQRHYAPPPGMVNAAEVGK